MKGELSRSSEWRPGASGMEHRETLQYFNAKEIVAWDEIVKGAPIGVLTSADRQIVEVLSRLIAECRENFIVFPVQKLARIESMLGKLGMTPADRSKVSGKKQDGNRNAFADL